jgi:hypothetical protein
LMSDRHRSPEINPYKIGGNVFDSHNKDNKSSPIGQLCP